MNKSIYNRLWNCFRIIMSMQELASQVSSDFWVPCILIRCMISYCGLLEHKILTFDLSLVTLIKLEQFDSLLYIVTQSKQGAINKLQGCFRQLITFHYPRFCFDTLILVSNSRCSSKHCLCLHHYIDLISTRYGVFVVPKDSC